MNSNPERIIFAEDVRRADVEATLISHGFTLEDEQGSSGDEPWAQAWHRGAEDITHVEDAVFGFRYVSASGPGAKELLSHTVAGLPKVALGDAIKRIVDANEVAEIVAGLGVVAGCAPASFDPRVFSAIGSCFSHSDRTVRFAAVAAAMYANWPEFAPVLEELAKLDSDPEVAEQAGLAATYVAHENPR